MRKHYKVISYYDDIQFFTSIDSKDKLSIVKVSIMPNIMIG